MPVDQVQKLINAIDNNKTEFTYSPIISEKLRELVKIPEPEKKLSDELKQQLESTNNGFKRLNNELEQTKDELKQQTESMNKEFKKLNNELEQKLKQQIKDELQQQMKNIQELLNSFIENSNSNKSNK